MRENETNFGRNSLRTISMSELYENIYPDKTQIIDGMLYGGTYLFVGAPKIGKSFLMAQIAYHVSTGTPLWGFPVRRGTVLYLALEDDFSRLQERMYRMFGITRVLCLHHGLFSCQRSVKGFVENVPSPIIFLGAILHPVFELTEKIF